MSSEYPVVKVWRDGRFVVAWLEKTWRGSDEESVSLRVRLFDERGLPTGDPFPIDTSPSVRVTQFGLDTIPDGGFIFIWAETAPDSSSDRHLVAGIYDDAGGRLGDLISVSVASVEGRADPDIAVHDDGSFTIVWRNGFDIAARRYNSDGTVATGMFTVSTPYGYTTIGLDSPSVAVNEASVITIAWATCGGDYWGGICGRGYLTDGSPLGEEFSMVTGTYDQSNDATVAMAPSGRFLLAWSAYAWDGSDPRVMARVFDETGSPVIGDFNVLEERVTEGSDHDAAISDEGKSVVVWSHYLDDLSSEPDECGSDVYARRFDSAGSATSPAFRVNEYRCFSQWGPAVDMTYDGRFVIVWTSWCTCSTPTCTGEIPPVIYAQRFDASGNPLGTLPW